MGGSLLLELSSSSSLEAERCPATKVTAVAAVFPPVDTLDTGVLAMVKQVDAQRQSLRSNGNANTKNGKYCNERVFIASTSKSDFWFVPSKPMASILLCFYHTLIKSKRRSRLYFWWYKNRVQVLLT
jgi:hypothetical protein